MVREDSLPSLTNIKLVHILAFCSITIYLNIIPPSRLGLPDDFPPSEIWTKILYSFPLIPCVLHGPPITSHVSLFYPHHHYLVKSIRHGSLHKTLDLKQYRLMVFQNFSVVEFFPPWNITRNPTPVFKLAVRQRKKKLIFAGRRIKWNYTTNDFSFLFSTLL